MSRPQHLRLLPSVFAAALLVALCVGCEPPKPGEPVTFDTVCDAKYDPVMEKGLHVTKKVALEGYLVNRSSMKVCSDTCDIDLYEKPEGKGRRVNIDVPVGDGKNQFERLPKNFKNEDVKLHTQDGKVVGVGAKVRVTGGRAPTGSRQTCALWAVTLIESL